MKKIITLLIIFSLFSTISFAQTYNLQFSQVSNEGTIGGNFDVKIQISGSSDFKLGASNITFNFSEAGLSNPSLLVAHNFNGVGGSPFAIYGDMTVTNPNPGVASINIVYSQTDETFASNVPTSFMDVATVRFTIVNNTLTSQLGFRAANPSPTVVFKVEGSGGSFVPTQLVAGTWSPFDTPLPVELSTFNVNAVEGTKAQLQWETATEINNYGFEIERSVVSESAVEDASSSLSMNWEKVAFVEGHGNSNSPKLYSFTDKNLVGGSKFMYRLKQIDIDGTFEYSDAVEIEVLPTKYELFQNYPNPFNPTTNIKFSLPEDARVNVNIYNILGEKVFTVLSEDLKAGFHQVDFNSTSAGYGIASGVYIYTIETKNFSQVKKMILMK